MTDGRPHPGPPPERSAAAIPSSSPAPAVAIRSTGAEARHGDALAIVAARLPALDHHGCTLDPEAIAAQMEALHQIVCAYGLAAREGDRVVLAVADRPTAVDAALAVAASRVADVGIGVAIGDGPAARRGAEVYGAEPTAVRRLVLLARVGEVLCTSRAHDGLVLPDGVGTFLAPGALSRAVGDTIHVLRDYR